MTPETGTDVHPLDQHRDPSDAALVRGLAAEVAARYGFSSYSSHVVRSGRQQFIEIGFVAPSGQTTMSFEQLDAIRREIALAMGGLNPGYWLTVDFTADERWI